MNVQTKRLGSVEVAASEILQFPDGLFGFEHVHRYALLERLSNAPFQWLQALDRSDLAFVVIEPARVCPGYEVRLSAEDTEAFGWGDAQSFEVRVIVGIPEDPEKMTANLKGPLVFDRARRVGRQVILPGDDYSPRFPILAAVREQRRTRARADRHASTGAVLWTAEGESGGVHG